jgi:hypothetical protein
MTSLAAEPCDELARPEPTPDGFTIVPVVISKYSSQRDLKDADAEAERIAAILARWGGVLDPWEGIGAEHCGHQAFARLQTWSTPPDSRSSLLLWIGHGFSNDERAAVIVPMGSGADYFLEPAQFAASIDTASCRTGRSSSSRLAAALGSRSWSVPTSTSSGHGAESWSSAPGPTAVRATWVASVARLSGSATPTRPTTR